MSHLRACFVALAVLLVPLGGCRCGVDLEPDGGEVDAGDAGGLTDDAYCRDLAQARCERELRCGFLGASELDTCRARLALECGSDFRREDAGAARFDRVAALACVAALGPLRCAEGPLVAPGACAFHEVFEPAAQLGMRCVDSEDCVAGFCFGTTFACRTCRAFAALGQPCGTDRHCDPALHFCAQGLPRVCTALLADGAPCEESTECATHWCNWNSQVPDAGPDRCGRLPPGAGCGDPGDCVSGAWCQGYAFDGLTVTAGVCAPRRALGEACTNTPDDDGCVEPASCLEGRCAVALPYSLDAGAECEHLHDCEEASFCLGREDGAPDGGRSLRSGVCAPRLPAGARCDFLTYVDTDCAPDTTCGASETCVPRGGVDAGCQARAECQDFLACAGSAGRCVPFVSLGQACAPAGAVCLDGWCGAATPDAGLTCLAPLDDGARCSVLAPAQCASSRCFATAGGDPSCQPACFP